MGFLPNSNIDDVPGVVAILEGEESPSWKDPLLKFLVSRTFPECPKETRKIKLRNPRFWASMDQKLYQKSFLGPYLLCVNENKVDPLLYEVHEGIRGGTQAEGPWPI